MNYFWPRIVSYMVMAFRYSFFVVSASKGRESSFLVASEWEGVMVLNGSYLNDRIGPVRVVVSRFVVMA